MSVQARFLQQSGMATNSDKLFGPPAALPEIAARDATCSQAMLHHRAGELTRAAQMYRAILQADPQHPAANYGMGMLFLQSKRATESLSHLLAAIATDPQVADYWLGLLEALLLADRTEEASDILALARQHGLGGRCADDFALRLGVKISAPAQELEKLLLAQVEDRSFADARSSARKLTEQFPDRGLGWKILGVLLAADGRWDDALFPLQQAAQLLPMDAEALCNLGVTLTKQERFKEAAMSLHQAISIDPERDGAYAHLGFVYAALEKYPQAESMYRRAVAASKPGDTLRTDMGLLSSLLFLLSHNPAFDAANLFAEHLVIGSRAERVLGSTHPEFSNARRPERRLNIGFVSGDFRDHALASFLEPILESLRNHGGLELHAYYNFATEDDVTRRLRNCFIQWHSVVTLSDLELLELIKANQIDVLIDLSSHTSFNRLSVFAQKAAPIQVSWLGYPGTTGLRAMDYYLADRHFLPAPHFVHAFTEKIVQLPAAWTFAPHAGSPPVNSLPALEAGFVTFGSFNRMGKINPFCVQLWCQLLRATPNSIILIAGIPDGEWRTSLTKLFATEGIIGERLAFFPRSNLETYLALHNLVDICLDTFPYTGGTTTNHALWMGVPTLTLTGRTPASRQGAANLAHVGLDGFTAADPDDFIRKGLYWSTHITALAEVRSGLRERWRNSALRRPEGIASTLDAALRHMWRRWCRDLPAQAFSITASNQVSQ